MARTVVFHSHRGGTGKSTVASNVAMLIASAGGRVAMVDTDIQSPALDGLFGLGQYESSLGDYLLGRCEIEAAAHPVGPPGLRLVPALGRSCRLGEIMATGYDVGLLPEGFNRLSAVYELDVLLLDTHTGLNNETMTAIACADVLVTVVRAELAELVGAEATVAMARPTDCRRSVVINMSPGGVDPEAARQRAEQLYRAPAVVLPYAPEISVLGGERILSEARPNHSLVTEFRQLISVLLD
ncbi:MinD/ParA family protein [Streptacidiphilus sp. N1-12]|uniref:MinD/ParA family protein n=2 Tax=Streptacidiphilus alkalitolerans TaxID=3342712 RepID=A0ABV6V3R5_9ACTN